MIARAVQIVSKPRSAVAALLTLLTWRSAAVLAMVTTLVLGGAVGTHADLATLQSFFEIDGNTAKDSGSAVYPSSCGRVNLGGCSHRRARAGRWSRGGDRAGAGHGSQVARRCPIAGQTDY